VNAYDLAAIRVIVRWVAALYIPYKLFRMLFDHLGWWMNDPEAAIYAMALFWFVAICLYSDIKEWIVAHND